MAITKKAAARKDARGLQQRQHHLVVRFVGAEHLVGGCAGG